MTKIIYGIFAHPDDEAFGPSGTMLAEVQAGAELHLLTLTLGEAGANPDNLPDLASVRQEEWQAAGQLIGATSQTYLGYRDGQLDNRDLISAGQKIYDLVAGRLETASKTDQVEFITSDLNGISGHIDHIVAARAASWAYYRLKTTDSRMAQIRYACLPASRLPEPNTDWLYMEAGRPDSEIDQVVDNRHLNDEIRAIMSCHQTQRQDLAGHLATRADELGLNYFQIKE